MAPRVLFYVQHLLGIGHLVRASRIASALASRFEVTLVVGGELPSGLMTGGDIDLVRLPPVKVGGAGFGALVHPDGRRFGPADQAMRRDLLLACLDRCRPDVLLIEAFPFGRRQMRFELLPLLEQASARPSRPMIAGSVRDILQTRRPDRDAETVDLVRRFFDIVLVHGDPDLFPLIDSFPLAGSIAERIRYTGMVGPPAAVLDDDGAAVDEPFDVIVSVGGGAVGAALIRTAIATKPLSRLADARWLVLTGPNVDGPATSVADDRLVLREFDPHLPRRLARARVSISQAGYNTVADLVATDCRPVLVPFGSGGETEQTRRAEVLQERGWAVMLTETELTPAALASALHRALDLPAARPGITLGGGLRTCEILARELAR